MPNPRLTKRLVDASPAKGVRTFLWDGELRGFGLKVEASGTKTYVLRYRPKGTGASAPKRFITLGRHGALTTEMAREAARAYLGQVAQGKDPAGEIEVAKKVATLGEVAAAFLEMHVARKRSNHTHRDYHALLTNHALPALGNIKADKITRSDIAKIHTAMASRPYNANRLLAVISSLYSFAAVHGFVPEGFNPTGGIEKYREEGRERYLNSEELERLGAALRAAETVGLPVVFDHRKPTSKHIPKSPAALSRTVESSAVAAIRLLIFTGARVQEILRLEWTHVDLQRGMLFLPASKTGRKTIVLNAPALSILLSLPERSDFGPFVIEGHIKGQPRSDLKRPWAAVRAHAGLDGLRLHDLRHTFASIGAEASLGLPIVGKLLGHSQPQTTARYAHLDADPLRRAANLIGDHLSRALEGIGNEGSKKF